MRIVQKEVLREFKKIAEKYDVPLQTVINIEASQWKLVKNKLTEGVKGVYPTFHNIYLRFLGTFYASEGQIKHMSKHDKQTRSTSTE